MGRLWSELIATTFDESVPAAGFGHADWPAGPFEPQSYRRADPRYFSDRRELLEILRRAVDTMFGGAAADAGKPTWCEKTPFNLLCMDFLWELAPEATIVHIKRHQVAVVASHVDQSWAPPTVEGALAWLNPVYDRWLAVTLLAYAAQLGYGVLLILNAHDSDQLINPSFIVFVTLILSLQRAWSLLKGKHLASARGSAVSGDHDPPPGPDPAR